MSTILVVDDYEIDRELATRCLAPLKDVEILYARDGEEALEVIRSQTPDAVLTDLRMPRMDGLELVEKVRDEFPLVPVILMTSQGSEQVAVRALQVGAASYVPKRDLKEELVETVMQVLDVATSRRSQDAVLRCLGGRETRFELDNDPTLVLPLVGFLQESLARLGFGNEVVRTRIGMAVMEAVSNAMIHGNLEVGSELRKESTEKYYEAIERRRRSAPYGSRRVSCVARESMDRVDYVVTDEGPGFDPSSLPDPTSPESLTRVEGRGLLLIRTFMDEVRHNDKGNQVTLTKRNRE